MGGVGDRKKGVEEVWRRPSPNCPCLDDPDDAGITVLDVEEEECDAEDFEEARIVRRWAAKEGCDRSYSCGGAAVTADRGE